MPLLDEGTIETTREALRNSAHPFLLRLYEATEADYEEIDNEDFKCEYLDGVLVVHSPATLDHEDLTGFVFALMRAHALRLRVGRVFGSNAVMQLGHRRFSPDISFLSTAGESRVKGGRVVGPMDLVVEVLSPSTRVYDRGEKLKKYREGRVPEIWLIDPDNQRFDAHVLDGDQYRSVNLQSGRLDAASLPGFAIMVEWLWQRPLPCQDECKLSPA